MVDLVGVVSVVGVVVWCKPILMFILAEAEQNLHTTLRYAK